MYIYIMKVWNCQYFWHFFLFKTAHGIITTVSVSENPSPNFKEYLIEETTTILPEIQDYAYENDYSPGSTISGPNPTVSQKIPKSAIF